MQEQLSQPGMTGMSFEERLALLVDREVHWRSDNPDGHFKFPHLWPVKFPQAGRLKYQFFSLPGSDLLSW